MQVSWFNLFALVMKYLCTRSSFAWRKKKYAKRVVGRKNPLFRQVMILKRALSHWDRFFETSVEDRTYNWNEIDDLFDPLCDYYSWAIPDERALNILSEFSPLVEIGCGNGYWAALLQNRGVDIAPFDVYAKPSKCWTSVYHGGPEILCHKYAKNRNLLLCYPDEQESIAFECLESFTGEYIIHVGELFTTGTVGGVPQAPYGRTSSSDFQVALVSSFHCLLVAELYLRLPFSKDCISVWKRTRFVPGRILSDVVDDDEDMDDDDEEDDDDDEEDEEDEDEDEDEDGDEEEGEGGFAPSDSAEDAVEYMSIEDLNKLREGSGGGAGGGSGGGSSGAKGKREGGEEGGEEGGGSGRAEKSSSAQESDSSSAVTFMDMDELRRLRASSESGTAVSASHSGPHRTAVSATSRPEKEAKSSSRGRPRMGLAERAKIAREAALDLQYSEPDDKLWACIPSSERLPTDRAAPCLQHLLYLPSPSPGNITERPRGRAGR